MTEPTKGPVIELSEREAREYRVARAIDDILADRARDGLVFDIDQQLRTSWQHQARGETSLIIPSEVSTTKSYERAGLDTATATKGQEAVFQQPAAWVDMLRAQSVVLRAGATFLNNLKGTFTMPVLGTGSGPVARAQNPGSDVSQVDPTFTTSVVMSPKGMQATTTFSRQLLAMSEVVPENRVDKLLFRAITRDHAALLDRMAVAGLGSSNQPKGVGPALAGAQLIALGTNGLQAVWANFVDIETAVANANQDYPDTDNLEAEESYVNAWVTHPTIRARARKTDRAGAATGWYIMGDEQHAKLMGYPMFVSTNVRSAQTKGTSSDCCDLLFGYWPDLWAGSWGPGLEIVLDPFTLKKQGVIEITSWHPIDIGIVHLGSFAGATDARP